MPININDQFIIDEKAIRFVYVASSGPGGQKVNKTASKAQLRFDIDAAVIPDRVRARLYQIARNRINEKGELVIESQRFRSQEQNRADTIQKLVNLLESASKEPKIRQKTRPTPASRKRRLELKKRRGETKRLRSRHSSLED